MNELGYDETLTKVAMVRAIESANNNVFSHTRPNGEDFATAYELYNMNWVECGENLGKNQTTISKVMGDWMNSPSHRENLLWNWTKVGIGIAQDNNGHFYFSQEFVR